MNGNGSGSRNANSLAVIVCGHRGWVDYGPVRRALKKRCPGLVIEGECPGADTVGRHCAEDLGIPVLPMAADWSKYHRAAGPIRNQAMLKALLEQPGEKEILAFHRDLTQSRGTVDMVRRGLSHRAQAAGVKVTVWPEQDLSPYMPRVAKPRRTD